MGAYIQRSVRGLVPLLLSPVATPTVAPLNSGLNDPVLGLVTGLSGVGTSSSFAKLAFQTSMS